MKILIDVFKMNELSHDTRISLIKKLGRAINHEHASNITEELVEELVIILQKQKHEPRKRYRPD